MERTNALLATQPVKLALESRGQKIDHEISILDLSGTELKVQGSLALQPGQVVEVVLSRCPMPCRVAWVRPLPPDGEVEAGLEFLVPLPRRA